MLDPQCYTPPTACLNFKVSVFGIACRALAANSQLPGGCLSGQCGHSSSLHHHKIVLEIGGFSMYGALI